MNPKTFDLVDDAIPVAERVRGFSVSDTGALAYLTGGGPAATQLTWFDRDGKSLRALGAPAVDVDLALSPDAKRVAVSRNVAGNRDIWLLDAARGVPTRFTFASGVDLAPTWSPDSTRIAFSRGAATYAQNSSGVGKGRSAWCIKS